MIDRKIKKRKMEEIIGKHQIQTKIDCWNYVGQEEPQMLVPESWNQGIGTGPSERFSGHSVVLSEQSTFKFANTICR